MTTVKNVLRVHTVTTVLEYPRVELKLFDRLVEVMSSRLLVSRAIPIVTVAVLLWSEVTMATPPDGKRYEYKQAFVLSDESGIGPNPVEGMLVLAADQERPFISRVLLQTLQEWGFSLPRSTSAPDQPLVPQQSYKTDIVPLSDAVVDDYNQKSPDNLRVDKTLTFGLQFEVRYTINVDRDRFFFIQLECLLYVKGAASTKWRDYKGSYSGDYFAARFTNGLRKNFTVTKPGQELHGK